MSEQVQQLEVSIEQAQEVIAQAKELDKLIKRREFKKLIDQNYFIDEASRLVHAKANPNLQDEYQQKMLDNQIAAIGYFRQYLSGIFQMANAAAQSIAADQETLDEIRQEELEDDADIGSEE